MFKANFSQVCHKLTLYLYMEDLANQNILQLRIKQEFSTRGKNIEDITFTRSYKIILFTF